MLVCKIISSSSSHDSGVDELADNVCAALWVAQLHLDRHRHRGVVLEEEIALSYLV